MTRLAGNYPSRSRNGKIELKILNQPEEQHRARYLTEGSRGSIKDGTGLGHPVVKLFGFNGCPVKLHCFIGHDKYIGVPHLFYQASRITGKNSTRCSTTKIEGTAVITLDLTPENSMQATIDCIGILKERNVDVEQKVLRLKSLNGGYHNGEAITFPSKKRCAKCRLVFRCKIPGTNEILQAVSTPILCTQPVGTPEICKMSLTECKISGGKELYLIGKNFLKDSKVIFKADGWCKVVEPDKEYLHSSHMICTIPSYDGSNHEYPGYFTVSINVRSGGKYSDSYTFTYINDSKEMSLNDWRLFYEGEAQGRLAIVSPPQSHPSNLAGTSETPQPGPPINAGAVTCVPPQPASAINPNGLLCGSPQQAPAISTNGMLCGSPQQAPAISANGMLCGSPQPAPPLNPSGLLCGSSQQSAINAASVACLPPQPTPTLSTNSVLCVSPQPTPVITNGVLCGSSQSVTNLGPGVNSAIPAGVVTCRPPQQATAINENGVLCGSLQPTATINSNGTICGPPQAAPAMSTRAVPFVDNMAAPAPNGPSTIQASQISAMSQMSDTELIRLINPSTFDEFKEDVSTFNFGFTSSNL